MKTATHTPGPWYWDKISTGHCRHVIVDSEGFTIANPSPMGEADARLIAAASMMLAALQRLVHPAADDTDVENALYVIARATGAA